MLISTMDLLKPKTFLAISQQPRISFDSGFDDLAHVHRLLAAFNKERLSPQEPSEDWIENLSFDFETLKMEEHVLQWEINQVRDQCSGLPRDPEDFMMWFEDLRMTGPGQDTTFFDWLEKNASLDEIKWFIQQEVAGEAGFEDLLAMTQVKFSSQAKMEMARNYWDEMGRGKFKGMHEWMLRELADELQLGDSSFEDIVPESLSLSNALVGFAVNRRYAYHSIGALGVIELTAPGRAQKVYKALKRLELSHDGQRYYLIHSTLDVKHSNDWNREVILPLIAREPELIPYIAEGALVRLNAGARCFRCYRKHLNLIHH